MSKIYQPLFSFCFWGGKFKCTFCIVNNSVINDKITLNHSILSSIQPICAIGSQFLCSHNRKLELNASYYSTEQIAMPTSKNTVVFIHQRADQKIIKAICLDLLVLSMSKTNIQFIWFIADSFLDLVYTHVAQIL